MAKDIMLTQFSMEDIWSTLFILKNHANGHFLIVDLIESILEQAL